MTENKTPKGPPLIGELPESEQKKYTDILLEEMRSKFQLVIEKIEGVGDRLYKKITSFEKNLSGRIDMVEMAIKATRNDLRDTEKSLKEEIKGVEKRLDAKITSVEKN